MQQKDIRKSDLTPRQFRLVTEMQRIRYGEIERLLVRDGEPEFIESTVSLPVYRIGGVSGPHPVGGRHDTILKAEVVALFDRFREIDFGLVRLLKIVDGLPHGFILEEGPGGGPSAAIGSLFRPVRPPFGGAAVNKISRGR